MLITTDEQADCTVVHLAGDLDFAAAAIVRRHLLKIMSNPPVAVVLDLHAVNSIEAACAAVFPAAWREGGGWPGVSMSLAAMGQPVRERLRAEGTSRFVPVHDDVESAVASAQNLPPYVSQTMTLRFDLLAARDARSCTRATFLQWRLRENLDEVLLAVSEMVSNCVLHGAPPLRMTMRLRRGLLRIAVNDGSAERPRRMLSSVTSDNLINGVVIPAHGRGLQLVEAVSLAWGVSDYASGPGKTVWCELRVLPERQ
ncbi:MAG: STAS domain-containing protein [Mycobacteriales bacterium]